MDPRRRPAPAGHPKRRRRRGRNSPGTRPRARGGKRASQGKTHGMKPLTRSLNQPTQDSTTETRRQPVATPYRRARDRRLRRGTSSRAKGQGGQRGLWPPGLPPPLLRLQEKPGPFLHMQFMRTDTENAERLHTPHFPFRDSHPKWDGAVKRTGLLETFRPEDERKESRGNKSDGVRLAFRASI